MLYAIERSLWALPFDVDRLDTVGDPVPVLEGVVTKRSGAANYGVSRNARFETEKLFAAADRCVVRWTYHWVKHGAPGHVRGVDLFRVRDGKVAEKLAYVKG